MNNLDFQKRNCIDKKMSTSNLNKRKSQLSYSYDDVNTCAFTEIEQKIFSFRWTLKNYVSLIELTEIRSPIFNGGPSHSWQLKLHPKYKFGNVDYLTVYLILIDFGNKDRLPNRIVKARFCISILNADGLPAKQLGSESKVLRFAKGTDLGDKLIPSCDVISTSERVLTDNAINIHCKIWIDGEMTHSFTEGGFTAKKMCMNDRTNTQRKEELATDLGRIFNESVMSDLKISTTDSSFVAHKAVLAARSSVFAAMLETNMKEKEQSVVQISDFDGDVVRGMLQYLYTGETPLVSQRGPDLLRIADKYDLLGLKEDCEHAICDNLSVDNAAEMLSVAHMYNATLLKQFVLGFIKRNATEVKKTKGFQNLQFAHPKVLLELYLSA